ncbi:UPF0481 protein At3g47200 [Lactuca sativa]|uniref:UPF0481 protein At3g47200 n=1 Tax=Lactuca sativa TaxID=4236 RepID=UPI000CAE3106|nr:UPF0481 protein At3g47200 [Lactuca sativa]
MENGDVDTNNIANTTLISILDFVKNRRSEDLLSTSINMVPSGLRDVSPSSYDPRVACIGPLHREDQNVQYFEELKANYVQFLLDDINSPPEQTLKECVQRVLALIHRIRACYMGTSVIHRYDDIELAKMMVTDACFMLHFINVITTSSAELHRTLRGTAILYDLILLENQIPFFVLQEVFNCTIPKSLHKVSSLPHLILKFVRYLNIFESTVTFAINLPSPPYDHILGFLAKCYWPSDTHSSFLLPTSATHSTIELDRAGVIFKPNEYDSLQLAIEFKSSRSLWCSLSREKPTLRMPVLRIDNYTELVLRNIIAYEQYFGNVSYVTGYAMAMDMLIDSEDDIAKLIESKVIVNHLGSNEKAANALNSLCKELPILNFSYERQWRDMDAHYNRYWPKNIAELKRTYFSSPWNLIALLAGIILFALTVVQTIYSVNAA